MIDGKDTSNLMKQLFWRPNILFSIINEKAAYGRGFYPLLFVFNKKFSPNNSYDKFLLFCLNCLLHLSFILLNEKENSNSANTPFLGKYLNFNNCNNFLIYDEHFWGIDCRVIDVPHTMTVNSSSIKCQMIETIMKLECYDGMSSIRREDVCVNV